MKMKMNNRSNRYRINRHMFRNSQKYSKYKTCANMRVLSVGTKRLVKLNRFQGLPLQLSRYQDLPPLSLALSYQL